MGSFKITVLSMLGMFPDTGKLEKKQTGIEEDFKKFNLFAESDELKHFQELEKYIQSDEFVKERERIKNLRFANTEQWKQLDEFTKLHQSKPFKTYFSVKNSENLKFFNDFADSDTLSKYNHLKSYFESKDYQQFLQDLSEKKKSLLQLGEEFRNLSKKPEIVRYFKIKNSGQLAKFQQVAKSEKLEKYLQLETFAKSEQLASLKSSLKQKLDELDNQLKKYKTLVKNKEIINYKKLVNAEQLKHFETVKNSDLPEKFAGLEKMIRSQEFLTAKKEMKKDEFQQSPFYEALQEYNALKNDKSFQAALKFEKSAPYQLYIKTCSSDLLAGFLELEKTVTAAGFDENMKACRYENNPEFLQEKEFFNLLRDKDIQHWLKYSKSDDLRHFNEIDASDLLQHFTELQSLVNSEKYKGELQSSEFKNTEQFKDLQSFENLKKDQGIVKYFKFEKSPEYATYLQIEGSDALKRYFELKETIESEAFKDFKAYMEDPKKWEKSEAYSKQQEYLKLKTDATIIWYFKCLKNDTFRLLKQWNLTFEDHFNQPGLDIDKWLTSYFWGEVLLHDSYVLEKDKHYLTNGKNIEIQDSCLKIITRREKVAGKSWTQQFGFMPKNFDYTSGIICTAHSFRQKYGKFEAKIKFSHRYPVYQAFWLRGDKITPEVDIAKYHHPKAGKLFGGNHWQENNQVKNKIFKVSGLDFDKKEYIYTLIWTPESLTWQINGITFAQQKGGLPDEPLYLIFNAGLTGEAKDNHLPVSMTVDWVRCYEQAEKA